MTARGPADRRGFDWRTLLYLALLAALVAFVVHPLRHHVVEPARQAVLGRRLSAGRRLALASDFGFSTAAGASVRVVPGRAALELSDLPTEALTVVLGGFRGPYVVWLWIQVEGEKQQKLHFDLIDRYSRIVALQSEYSQVWSFHIWNLAWNVSVQWQSPRRKYKWIRAAIELAREGYRKNPRSAEIMATLGRIYSEKCGLSQEAPYYRRQIREEEGRSTFLLAYEWYDRACRAHDRFGTSLGFGLAAPVHFRHVVHNLTFYSRELSLEAYEAFKQSLDARRERRDDEARETFERGMQGLADAARAWQWTAREWRAQALRFEKEGLPPEQMEIYKRFYTEADHAAAYCDTLRASLTYDSLPREFEAMPEPSITQPLVPPGR